MKAQKPNLQNISSLLRYTEEYPEISTNHWGRIANMGYTQEVESKKEQLNNILKEYLLNDHEPEILFIFDFNIHKKNTIETLNKKENDPFIELANCLRILNKYDTSKVEITIRHNLISEESIHIKSPDIKDIIKDRLEDYYFNFYLWNNEEVQQEGKRDIVKQTEETIKTEKEYYSAKGRREVYSGIKELIVTLYKYIDRNTKYRNESKRQKHLIVFRLAEVFGFFPEYITFKADRIRQIIENWNRYNE